MLMTAAVSLCGGVGIGYSLGRSGFERVESSPTPVTDVDAHCWKKPDEDSPIFVAEVVSTSVRRWKNDESERQIMIRAHHRADEDVSCDFSVPQSSLLAETLARVEPTMPVLVFLSLPDEGDGSWKKIEP